MTAYGSARAHICQRKMPTYTEAMQGSHPSPRPASWQLARRAAHAAATVNVTPGSLDQRAICPASRRACKVAIPHCDGGRTPARAVIARTRVALEVRGKATGAGGPRKKKKEGRGRGRRQEHVHACPHQESARAAS